MPRKIPRLVLFTLVSLGCTALHAQNKEARDRLTAAHALYYTPTASGLKSFRCDANIDWKSMLTRFSGTEVSDDNAALKFLQTVHLSVADDLKGNGALEWNSPSDGPADKQAAIKQIREGLQTSVSGFFQSWNAYMNGGMVPVPDSTVIITKSGTGVHLGSTSNDSKFDEDFDKNMLLTQVLVVTANIKVLATPTYSSTPDGLIVSGVKSEVSQPPAAPPIEAIFRIDYARVDAFQIPSRIVFDIKNTGVIEIGFSACQVSLADWAKKPSSR
jgi:hypothetical protein